MKVELQCGDTIAIPEGCKATIKGGSVVFEKEEKEFKRGDVIVSKKNEILLVDVHCFENRILRSFVHIQQDGTLFNSSYSLWNELHTWRLATEKEKQLLFDKMKEQGLRWNAEEKRVEKIRWRAEKGKDYYFVYSDLTTVNTNELGFDVDTDHHNAFNYFRTEEQAQQAAERVKETLRKYHEEIGE